MLHFKTHVQSIPLQGLTRVVESIISCACDKVAIANTLIIFKVLIVL